MVCNDNCETDVTVYVEASVLEAIDCNAASTSSTLVPPLPIVFVVITPTRLETLVEATGCGGVRGDTVKPQPNVVPGN